MNWIILIIAGLFETGFATCLGKAQETTGRESYFWWAGFAAALIISMFLMFKAISVGSNPIPIGTADAVSFRNNTLRIHDLKTGESKASMDQLLIYAAIFCLEYRFKPTEINVELRIYQSDEIAIYEPSIDELFHVIDRIVMADKRIDQLRADLED